MTSPQHAESPSDARVLVRLSSKLDEALDATARARPVARATHQTQVFQLTEVLMRTEGGLQALYARAHRFDEAGVFSGGPWVDPGRLQPPLVRGSLVASGVYPVVETLSELRVLAIATGRVHSERMSAAAARRFLDEVMALNLDFLFPGGTEQERVEAGDHLASNQALFRLIADEIGLDNLRDEVIAEVGAIAAQRPIMTDRLVQMIRTAARIPGEPDERLERFVRAVDHPSPRAAEAETVARYRSLLNGLDETDLAEEADAFGASLRDTGLAAPAHAVLLRHLIADHPLLAPRALGLSRFGAASLEANLGRVRRIVRLAVHPTTCQCLYGLARVLERGLLAQREIVQGLRRVRDLDMRPEVRRALLAQHPDSDGLNANALLLAGCVSMLGQPLGIGQGHNPTCQAARGLSLWAQHAPGYLLKLVVSAARDGHVSMRFQGEDLRSDQLAGGVARRIDPELDPVSLVVVPHLDRLYDEMMRRVALRGEDGHKYVNPALYGRWVSTGFASVFLDVGQTTIADHAAFVRTFFGAFHPAHNGNHRLMYPVPVGLVITNSRGDYLGAHAVSLQRVAPGPDGALRAYFYNPNNEGRQDWGGGVRPSVQGHGEREGESSLPFGQFLSRTYAFHYNPYEVGDPSGVPAAEVEAVSEQARETWGRAFTWA